MEETHARDLIVETHSTNLEGLLLSLQAGIDLVQHPEYTTRELTDEIIDWMVEKKVICSMLSNTITGDVWQRHKVNKEVAKESIRRKDVVFQRIELKVRLKADGKRRCWVPVWMFSEKCGEIDSSGLPSYDRDR